jgi:hypothetical protein
MIVSVPGLAYRTPSTVISVEGSYRTFMGSPTQSILYYRMVDGIRIWSTEEK